MLYPSYVGWSSVSSTLDVGFSSFLIPLDAIADVVRAGACIALVVAKKGACWVSGVQSWP